MLDTPLCTHPCVCVSAFGVCVSVCLTVCVITNVCLVEHQTGWCCVQILCLFSKSTEVKSGAWWSKVAFVFDSRPNRDVPADRRRANWLTLISSPERNAFPCVYVCVWCYCFIVPILPPPPEIFSGAAGCYLKLTLTCAVTSAAAGGRNETNSHTFCTAYTHRGLRITGLCMLSVYTPPHHPPSPCCLCISAHCIRPTVHYTRFHLCWGGVVVYYSWVVRSEARVIWQK